LDEDKSMKKISVIGFFISGVILTGLTGCASHPAQPAQPPPVQASQPPPVEGSQPPPPKPKGPLEDRLSVGMTMEQVRAACGHPKNQWMNSNGSAVWGYNDSEMALIPNYTLFGGKIHHVRVYFDMNGRVARWEAWSNGRY
jgi:hypothetical protein